MGGSVALLLLISAYPPVPMPPSGTDKELEIGLALKDYWDGETWDLSFDFKYKDGKSMEVDEVKEVMEEQKKDYEHDQMGMKFMIKIMEDLKLQEEEEKELQAEEEKAKEKVKELKRILEEAEEEERQLIEKRQKLSAKRVIAATGVELLAKSAELDEEEQEGKEMQKLKEEFLEEYKKASENFSGSAVIYKSALLILTNILHLQLMSPIFTERASSSDTNEYLLTILDFIPKPIVPYLTSTLLDNLQLITNEFAFLNHFMPFYNRYMETNSRYDSPQTTEWPLPGTGRQRNENGKNYLESLLKKETDGVRPGRDLYYLPTQSGWVLYNFKNGRDPVVPVVGRLIRDYGAGAGGWFNYRGGDERGMLMVMHEKLKGVTLVNGERQHIDGDDQMENIKVTMFTYETIMKQCHLITYAKAVEIFFHAKGSARVKMFKYIGMAQKLEKRMEGYK